ncbi:DsbA family protein [Candidatus Gracilibacteria bacterium]|nr:DsbA family protein [Candidatus Gracilibacteria bacterium]
MKNLSIVAILLSVIAIAGVGYSHYQITQINNLPVIQDSIAASQPFNVTFVSDEADFGEKIEKIKEKIFKTMEYKIVSSTSPEGKKLIAKFDAKSLPLMVTGKAIEKSEIKDYLSQLAVEKDGEYSVKIGDIAQQMGVSIDKIYLKVPEIAEWNPVKGPSDAKVTFIEVTDFECPFCSKFHNNAYKKVVEKYGDKIKFVFKNLPLGFHKNAQKAAEAGLCANEQGKFWEMHNKMFENQKELGIESYKKWAGELGLDQAKFDKCLDSGAMEANVKADAKEANSFGIQGTPGVFVNDKFVGGAYPFETFEKLIEAELAK